VGIAPYAGEQRVGERCEMAREDLGVRTILLGERAGGRPALEIEDAERRITSDRRTQDLLDVRDLDAALVAKAGVEKRRRGHDRLAGRERLGADPARDVGADVLELLVREAVRNRPASAVAGVRRLVQLEVPLVRSRRLDDERERVPQKAREVVLRPELQEPA